MRRQAVNAVSRGRRLRCDGAGRIIVQTAKLHEIDPQAWLADVRSRIAETPQSRLTEILPWNLDLRPPLAHRSRTAVLSGGLPWITAL
jgi:transposase IS66-like protein